MAYTDFAASAAYRSKHAGAAIGIKIFNEASPSGVPMMGSASGISANDDFEAVAIEEAGNDGVDEYADGRHAGAATVQAFWDPERSDRLPTRQTFVGKRWTIQEVIAKGRDGEGTVVECYMGCVIQRVSMSHGARGAKTVDIQFAYRTRYNGVEWAEKAGQQ